MIDIGYYNGTDSHHGLRLRCAGHIFAAPGRRIDRPAGREDWLLFYVAAGSETFFLPQGEQTAEAGDLILFAPGEPQRHVCRSTGTAEFYYVHFYPEPAASLPPIPSSTVCRRARGRDLSGHFQHMIRELQQDRPYCHEIAVSRLEELFFLLHREQEGAGADRDPAREPVRRMIHEINRTWREPLTLEDYAARAGLSKYHFSRCFRAVTGMSPIRYRNRLRLRWAAQLLEETDEPIAALAAQAGFESSRYFSDAFKAAYGCAPAEYRKGKR